MYALRVCLGGVIKVGPGFGVQLPRLHASCTGHTAHGSISTRHAAVLLHGTRQYCYTARVSMMLKRSQEVALASSVLNTR